MLLQGESMADYKAVTPTEKAQIEDKDAQWKEPAPLLIQMWENAFAGFFDTEGGYNSETGYFYGNGLYDLTTDDVIRILRVGVPRQSYAIAWFAYESIRTNLPIPWRDGFAAAGNLFIGNANTLETAHLGGFSVGMGTFAYMTRLRRIVGRMNVRCDLINDNSFLNCSALEEIDQPFFRLTTTAFTLNFAYSPKLKLTTVDKIIAAYPASATATMTLRLHADVYAQLTEAMFAAASAKNIQIATT